MKKYKKLGSAAAVLCSVAPAFAPVVGAEEVKPASAAVEKVSAQQDEAAVLAKEGAVVKSELVAKDASLGNQLFTKKPATLRISAKLGGELKDTKSGSVELNLHKDFSLLEVKDGEKMVPAKVRIMKGSEVIREVEASKVEEAKAEEKVADKKEDAKPAENAADKKEEAKPAENKAEDKQVEALNSASTPKANDELKYKVALEEKDFVNQSVTLEVDLVATNDDARLNREIDADVVLGAKSFKAKVQAELVLEKEKGVKSTRFVDDKGETIIDEKFGDKFEDKIDMPGYVYEGVEEKDGVRTHKYKKVKVVKTRFVDADGKSLRPDAEGSVDKEDIKGYRYVNVTTDADGVMTYHYAAGSIVKSVYLDSQGKELQEPVMGEDGGKKEFKGYVLSSREDKDGVITYTYKPAPADKSDLPEQPGEKPTDKPVDKPADKQKDEPKKLPKTGAESVIGTLLAGATALGGSAIAIFKRRKG